MPDAAGHVDFFTFHPEAGGLLFCGWTTHEAVPLMHTGEFVARFAGGEARGMGMATFYVREGLEARGMGMVLFVECDARPEGALIAVAPADLQAVETRPTRATQELKPDVAAAMLQPLIRRGDPALPSIILEALLPPKPAPVAALLERAAVAPEPARNLDELGDKVMLQLDEAIFCPPAGVVLIGWCLARPGSLEELRLRSGAAVTRIDLARAIRVARPGVIDSVGRAHGHEDVRKGFMAYLPDGFDPSAVNALEVLTREGEVGTRAIPKRRLHGLPAIRHLLGECDAQYADVAPAFDHVLGPAVARLNAERLSEKGDVARIDFGPRPEAPPATIVIPLHGRTDFAELQCALFAADPALAGSEIVYVLDDPKLRREVENLAGSINARLGLPLTLLAHERNLGFAPACNAGLTMARGRKTCFLNSDAFPTAPGWLAALAARLDADSTLGIVGPLMLHEDGSVQHEGMEFWSLPQFAGWQFGHHTNLGRRPSGAGGLTRHPAITGACMVIDTVRARAMGGFDEAYVMGDFEDSDLCLRAAARGLGCAVDRDVRLVHFGRRSQPSASERWRMNLILHNAWVHQGRWGETIAAMSQAVGGAA